MAVVVDERDPIAPSDDERQTLLRIGDVLGNDQGTPPRLVGLHGEEIEIPAALVRTLQQAVHALTEGAAIAIVPVHKDLTTNEAADLLNVSRPYLIRLLDQGAIPYAMVGTHRRIKLDDLMTYRRARDAKRHAALDRLMELSQEMGLYTRD